MKLLNNNNVDYRSYEVEIFECQGDDYSSYTDDIIIDITKDNYENNDDFHKDLFDLIERNYNMEYVYKIRVSELFSIDNKIYRCTYIKDETGIHHIKNDIFTINN